MAVERMETDGTVAFSPAGGKERGAGVAPGVGGSTWLRDRILGAGWGKVKPTFPGTFMTRNLFSWVKKNPSLIHVESVSNSKFQKRTQIRRGGAEVGPSWPVLALQLPPHSAMTPAGPDWE